MPMNPRLLVPRAAGGFDPRKIANCTAWFDAEKALTLNGSTVSVWTNLVTGGTDFTQATAADQPSTSTLGGRRAVSFPSSATVHLSGPTIAAAGNTSTNTLLMFFVVQYTGTSNNAARFLSQGTTNGGLFGWYPRYSNGSSFQDLPEGTARVSGSVTGTTINSAPTICRVRRADTNASLHYNATQIASRANASGALFSTTSNALRLNGQDASNSIVCAEVVMFSRDLTSAEVSTIETGLARKYGVTL